MPDYFDRLTHQSDPTETGNEQPRAAGYAARAADPETSTADDQYTPTQLKASAQELLKYGLLEADRKPNLYQVAVTQATVINRILEPFDLRLEVDDIRGLAFLVVAEQLFKDDESCDEWSHPLVRRQRLTLEQSLLVAILRQHYIVHEQEAGLGAGDARVDLEELLTQLHLYLGSTGSDSRDQKRLRNLLETLGNHGMVSDIDANEQVVIRPLITHLANPENLQNLLNHFRSLATRSAEADGGTP